MKINKIFINITILIITMVNLSGCWSYNEVDDKYIIIGVAIDYDDKTEEYILTVESVNPKETELGIRSSIFYSKGKTIHDAIRNLIMKSGKMFYWAHAKVIIVSKKIAEKNIIPVIDLVYRDPEYRDDIWLIISSKGEAGEILDVPKEKLHRINSFHMDDIFKTNNLVAQFKELEVWQFVRDLYSEGLSPTLPITTLVSRDDYNLAEISGTALFKDGKMIGQLNRDESKMYLLVTEKVNGGIIIVKSNTKDMKPIDVVLEIGSSTSKIEPKYKDKKLVMKIHIKENILNIGEIDGTEDFISDEGRERLRKDAEKQIQSEIKKLIKKVQRDYKRDIFGFSTEIKKKMPEYWKEIKPNWEEIFSNLEVNVKVDLDIKASSLSSQPIKIRY